MSSSTPRRAPQRHGQGPSPGGKTEGWFAMSCCHPQRCLKQRETHSVSLSAHLPKCLGTWQHSSECRGLMWGCATRNNIQGLLEKNPTKTKAPTKTRQSPQSMLPTLIPWSLVPTPSLGAARQWSGHLLGTHLGDIAADTADVADAADSAGDGGDTDGGVPQPQSHLCKGSKRHVGSDPAHRLSPTAGEWLWLGYHLPPPHILPCQQALSSGTGKGLWGQASDGEVETPHCPVLSSSPSKGTFCSPPAEAKAPPVRGMATGAS